MSEQKTETAQLVWTTPALESLGDAGKVHNNTGSDGDGGSPGSNNS